MQRHLEEILEALWKADEKGDISTKNILANCDVKFDNTDLDLLEKRKLIAQSDNRLSLSYEGREFARGIVRRHRLAETLFATILDLDFEKREALACEVEHSLLPEVEEAICILLGHPTVCPDNKTIPTGACCVSRRKITSTLMVELTAMAEGEKGRITFIKSKNRERLDQLTTVGLIPGTVVKVLQTSPAICIKYEGTELALNKDAAEDILVTKIR